MSMFADPDSRGGILEPAGIIEVKFRLPDQLKVMHRLDPQLQLLDSELEMTELEIPPSRPAQGHAPIRSTA